MDGNRKIKILHVMSKFGASSGGPTNQVCHLSKLLSKNGYEVSILTTDYNIDDFYIKKLEGVADIKVAHSMLGRYMYCPELTKILDNYLDYDVFQLWGLRGYLNMVAYKFCKTRGIPYIIKTSDTLPVILRSHVKKKVFDLVVGNRMLKEAASLIAITQDEINQYLRKGVDINKIRLIPPSVHEVQTGSDFIKGRFRNEIGISQSDKVILFLGRVHKKKGIDWLLSVFEKNKRKWSNVKLVIVGPDDGFMKPLKALVLKKSLHEQVIFVGPIYGESKMSVYFDADIFVLPSMRDAVPGACLEAGMAGLPLVVTETCGIPEVTRYRAGFEVVYRNSQSLERALQMLLFNKELRCKMGDNAKRMVTANFTYERLLPKYEELYREAKSLKKV